jgi:hypothetical protein
MNIKSKADAQKLVDFMKESEHVLKYKNEFEEDMSIQYDNELNYFHRITDMGKGLMRGMSYESDLVKSLYKDRKFVNPSLYHWNI